MIAYEWAIEPVDEFDDIIDVTHADTYAEALERAAGYPIGESLDEGRTIIARVEIALTRLYSRDFEVYGLEEREYAYLGEDGRLPANFDAESGAAGKGAKVPARFHREVEG